MIRLTVIGEGSSAERVATESIFRITGPAVWLPDRVSRGTPLTHYSSGFWHYKGRVWSGLRFDGRCVLMFGLPRDPAGTSDRLSGISIHGTSLIANGLPFAEYDPDKDIWHGANRWWHAFRVEYVSTGANQARSLNDGRLKVLVVSSAPPSGVESPSVPPEPDSPAKGN